LIALTSKCEPETITADFKTALMKELKNRFRDFKPKINGCLFLGNRLSKDKPNRPTAK